MPEPKKVIEQSPYTLKGVRDGLIISVQSAFGFDPIDEVQILTPMNRGVVGTANLNIELQKALNPALWDDPDSEDAAKVAAQGLGELYMNGLDAVVTTINLHFLYSGEDKFQPDL